MTGLRRKCEECSKWQPEEDIHYYKEVDKAICIACTDEADAQYDAWMDDQGDNHNEK